MTHIKYVNEPSATLIFVLNREITDEERSRIGAVILALRVRVWEVEWPEPLRLRVTTFGTDSAGTTRRRIEKILVQFDVRS